VDYNTKDGKRKKGDFDDTPADRGAISRANAEWRERYGSGKDAGKGLDIGDILGKGASADVGVKVSD
jgi:hypothetical protein